MQPMLEYIRFDDDPPDLMFVKDVCQYLGISRVTLKNWRAQRQRTDPMPFRKGPGRLKSQLERQLLVTTRGELDAWLARNNLSVTPAQEISIPKESESAETSAGSDEKEEVKFENLEMKEVGVVPEESAEVPESVRSENPARKFGMIPVEVLLTPMAYKHCKRLAGYQRRPIEKVVMDYLWQSPLALYRF